MNAFDPDRIPLALTFDDVLLRPGRSAVLPAQASTRTRLTRGIEIGIRRLEARPTAELCIDCKELAEIKEKQLAG